MSTGSELSDTNRSGRWRRTVAGAVLAATLLGGAGSFLAPGTAHATDYHICGHAVTTTHNEGWVILRGLTDAEHRPDIQVVGIVRVGDTGIGPVGLSAWDAIRNNTQWAAGGQTTISIQGTDCRVAMK